MFSRLADALPWCRCSNEELRAVGVLTSIRHAHETLLGVLELEVLIFELVSIDYCASIHVLVAFFLRILTGFATSTIALCEITTLNHESLNDTVESRALISESFLSRGQSTKVLSSLWDGLAVKTDHNATHFLISMGDVEEDLVSDLGAFVGHGWLRKEDKDNR